MNKVQKSYLGAGLVTLLSTSSVFATGLGGNVGATAVPTLSATMLIVLSLLLFAFAYRLTKQNNGMNKLFVSILGLGVLLSVTGGIKLVSEVNAGEVAPPIVFLNEGLGFHALDNPNDPNSGYEGLLINNTGQPITVTLTPDQGSACFIANGDELRSAQKSSAALVGPSTSCGSLNTNFLASNASVSVTIGAGQSCYVDCSSNVAPPRPQ